MCRIESQKAMKCVHLKFIEKISCVCCDRTKNSIGIAPSPFII